MSTPTIRQVLTQLQAEGVQLPPYDPQRVFRVQPPSSSPWYVRLFAGFGAWTAALLLVAFLFVANIIESEGVALVLGLVLCAGMVVLSRTRSTGDFLEQLGLSLSLVGQVLFAFGVAALSNEADVAALAVIMLQLALLAGYADQFHRFLSGLWIVGALLVLLVNADQFNLIHLVIVGLAGLITVIVVYEFELLVSRWWEIVHPVGYAATVALLGLLVLPLQTELAIQWWGFTAVALLAILGIVIWRISIDLALPVAPLQLGIGLVLGVGLMILGVKMPGVAAALLVLVLGYWRSNHILLGLAGAFLVFYMSAYYYSLELTLLNKSLLLLGTGGLLLTLRAVLLRTNPESEEVQ
ncbi:MAG: DUF4401 domain-containing protein [Herpetosiphonaceae bacterium]|nr:DUF4401 domain-containing protein [Herpetosiphonaceae bacterium]